jgi:hypothetical protein
MNLISKAGLATVLFLMVFSCEETPFVSNVNCDECYYNKPDSADLIVSLTINSDNPFVPLVFYKGEVEENMVEWVDTAYTETLYLYSPVNQYYSIKANYKKGDMIVIAIDGDKLKTTRVSDVCDTDCWIIKGGELDVRLKEY